MLLSAVSVLVVAQSSSEIPEGLMNNPVFENHQKPFGICTKIIIYMEVFLYIAGIWNS